MSSSAEVQSRIVDIDALDWKELLPGVLGKRVWADPATNRVAMFIRFSPGAELPRHAHAGDELVYVIEGSVADDHGAVTAGCVGYRPDGCTHTVRSPNGATAFAVVTGSSAPVAAGTVGGPPSQVFDVPAMAWVDARPGVRTKRFFADGAADRSASFSRFEPGATLPAHRHRGDELVFVVEGTVDDEAGSLRPGLLGYRPDGCAHTVTSPNGATVVAFLWGGVEPI